MVFFCFFSNNNVRTFYGKSHSPHVSKYVQLSEATTAATSSAADEIDLVILPPNGRQLSEEEQIDENNDILPTDVAGQIEVHEYENVSDQDDENEFDNDELQPSKKKSKSKSVIIFFVIIKERNQYESSKIFLTFQT